MYNIKIKDTRDRYTVIVVEPS